MVDDFVVYALVFAFITAGVVGVFSPTALDRRVEFTLYAVLYFLLFIGSLV